MVLKKLILLMLISPCVFFAGCMTRTAMSDRSLRPLWDGQPLPDEQIAKAQQDWKNDASLINMQEGINLLRRGDLSGVDAKRARAYLEQAFLTFEDLRSPENFSVAFTSDNQTPYRGRPFERVLVSTLLGLLDAAEGRCDLAIPAFRAAEFLDARWKAFSFGTDTPLVYALMLRCLQETKAAAADIERAREGLERAVRLQLLLEAMLSEVQVLAKAAKDPAPKIALALFEVGIPSALLSAPASANVQEILEAASAESMRFLFKVLKEKEQPYFDIVRPLLAKMDKNSTAQIEEAMTKIRANMLEIGNFRNENAALLHQAKTAAKQIEEASKRPVVGFRFAGFGPSIVREGSYNEIARVVPSSASNARAGVRETSFDSPLSCGVSNDNGIFTAVLCRNKSKPVKNGSVTGYQLWSSSFKATTMIGRKFDRILKGRAQFRMGTEVAAIVGGVVALSLLDAGIASNSTELQAAGAIVGLAAGAAWLAGRATNPEADIRHVMHDFETGYLLTP